MQLQTQRDVAALNERFAAQSARNFGVPNVVEDFEGRHRCSWQFQTVLEVHEMEKRLENETIFNDSVSVQIFELMHFGNQRFL